MTLTKSPLYAEQFSAERLADAMAICREEWGHFASSSGAYPTHGRRHWLPTELARDMWNSGKRGHQVSRSSFEVPSAWMTEPDVRPMRQRYHALGVVHGVTRGPKVMQFVSKTQVKTVAELKARPVVSGTFVVTLPGDSSSLARTCRGLQGAKFWLWKVLRVLQPGDPLPPNTRHVTTTSTTTYESQLYVVVEPQLATSPFKPLWDKLSEAHFLKTPAEKRQHHHAAPGPASLKMRVPLTAMLRPENVICGGFSLTGTQRLPAVARELMAEQR